LKFKGSFRHGKFHLKSLVVETSADGQSEQKVTHEKNNKEVNGALRTHLRAAGNAASSGW
jgi:hypothetical protein